MSSNDRTTDSAAVLRLAHAEDFDAIAAITNHYIRTTAIHFGYEETTADELRPTWRDGPYPWLVSSRGGDVVGYAKAGVFRARRLVVDAHTIARRQLRHQLFSISWRAACSAASIIASALPR